MVLTKVIWPNLNIFHPKVLKAIFKLYTHKSLRLSVFLGKLWLVPKLDVVSRADKSVLH